MPVLHQIEPNCRAIYIAGFARCTGDELLRTLSDAFHSSLRQPDMFMIIDFQKVTAIDIEIERFKEIIQIGQQIDEVGFTPAKTAIIARDGQDISLFSAFTLITHSKIDLDIKSFLGLDSALAWLGLSEQNAAIEKMRDSLDQAHYQQINPKSADGN